MADSGFLEQKARPGSAALVILMHGAGIAALALASTQVIRPRAPTTTTVVDVKQTPPPEVVEPEPLPKTSTEPQTHQSVLDAPAESPLPTRGPTIAEAQIPPQPPVGDISPEPPQPLPPADPPRVEPPPPPPPPPPVRLSARLNTSNLQPPYPASLQRDQIEGSATVRVTVGTDGRVTAVQKVSATHDAFYTATARHAQARWRFRPATVDGRAVESTQNMTVHFRLDE